MKLYSSENEGKRAAEAPEARAEAMVMTIIHPPRGAALSLYTESNVLD